jgi:hypothetical protein
MFDLPMPLLAVVIATFFAAGVVKGVTGMGHRSRSRPEPPCGGEWIHGIQLTAAS